MSNLLESWSRSKAMSMRLNDQPYMHDVECSSYLINQIMVLTLVHKQPNGCHIVSIEHVPNSIQSASSRVEVIFYYNSSITSHYIENPP